MTNISAPRVSEMIRNTEGNVIPMVAATREDMVEHLRQVDILLQVYTGFAAAARDISAVADLGSLQDLKNVCRAFVTQTADLARVCSSYKIEADKALALWDGEDPKCSYSRLLARQASNGPSATMRVVRTPA